MSRVRLALALLALTSLAAPRTAHAQIEARCPAGWESLPSGGSPGQRIVAACVHDPMQLVVLQFDHPIAPGSPDEQQIQQQLAGRIGNGGAGSVTPFRSEAIGTLPARVSEVSGATQGPNGASMPLGGQLVLMPAGGSTLVVMAVTRDPTHNDVRPVVRQFLSGMVGLSGPAPAWRASATCPPGMQDVTSQSPASSGMRGVLRCTGQNGLQLEVLESRLPVRTPEEAREPAESFQRTIDQRLRMLGGSATLDATQPITWGAQHGYVTPIHASASDPRLPGGGVHVEAVVAIVPTSIGHVQVVGVMQNGDPAVLLQGVRDFVAHQLRTDGVGVVAAPTPSAPAPSEDAGTATQAEAVDAGAAPPARHHEIDLSRPLWQPPAEQPLHPTERPSSSKGCGCRTPGSPTSDPRASAALLALCAVLVRRRRRGRQPVGILTRAIQERREK